jgi:hypothetical protein
MRLQKNHIREIGGRVSSAHVCQVCGYPELEREPRTINGGGSYEICDSCGFQFGVSDEDCGYFDEAWRSRWTGNGMRWSSVGSPPPECWNPRLQLARLMAAGPAEIDVERRLGWTRRARSGETA